jgi:beta-lactamase regulating signal transducer with metallopeptidase domain
VTDIFFPFQTCLSRHDDDLAVEKKRQQRISSSQSARQPKAHNPAELLPVTSDKEESRGGGGAVAAIVLLLGIVAVVGVGAFLIFRTRLAPRLRARLTNTPYGDIVGGINRRSESTQNVIA